MFTLVALITIIQTGFWLFVGLYFGGMLFVGLLQVFVGIVEQIKKEFK